MLINANLPKFFWAEAVHTATYLMNRSPSSAINFECPEKIWSGKTIDYSNLKVFGCPAYAHVIAGKLDPRSIKRVFLGYGDGVKGYRLWCLDSQKLIYSRDVKFNEEMLKSSPS